MIIDEDRMEKYKRSIRRHRKNRLSNITVDEVSLVDRPANLRPFLLYKKMGQDFTLADLNDPELGAQLEEEWENATPEEKAEILAELEKIASMLDGLVMSQQMRAIYKGDRALFNQIRENPERFNWDIETGFSLKEVYKFKLTKTYNEAKTHYFDTESLRWVPVGR